MGYQEYHPLAKRYRVPIVVTGFEPVDLLEGIWRAVRQLEEGRAEVENQYSRIVRPEGNPAARAAIERSSRSSIIPGEESARFPPPAWRCGTAIAGSTRASGSPTSLPRVRARRVQERRGAGRPAQAKPVPGLRHRLQPRPSPGRDHGLGRRGLCGVLSVSPSPTRFPRCRCDVELERFPIQLLVSHPSRDEQSRLALTRRRRQDVSPSDPGGLPQAFPECRAGARS